MRTIKTIAVVGLGYVGLPLALLAARKGYATTGIEIDEKKVNKLKQSISYIDDVVASELRETNARFTTDFSSIRRAEAVVICVPTPVNIDKTPNLDAVRNAVVAIAPYLRKDTLVVLESTVNPGVCDEIITPILEEVSGKVVGQDLYLAHCPERVNPGDTKWNVSNINRVIGTNTKKEMLPAKAFYESLIDAEIMPMGSLKEAESVKVVENSFRDINIAFVNELAMSFQRMGINVESVIRGASTKPFAFMPHFPGCGVGGHCIPVDPYYLIEYANGYGFNHEFLRLARKINENMPSFTIDLLELALNERGRAVKGAKIALLGLSYKPDVGDGRESPAYAIKHLLLERGADLITFDPYLKDRKAAASLNDALEHASAIVLATGHRHFLDVIDAKLLVRNTIDVVIDGRNLWSKRRHAFKRAGIIYKGIGVQ